MKVAKKKVLIENLHTEKGKVRKNKTYQKNLRTVENPKPKCTKKEKQTCRTVEKTKCQ
jgi:hypothetical protein